MVLTKHADTGKVIFAKLPPEALVEATNSIVCVGRTLAIRNAIEEVAVVGPLLPHPLHLGTAWLEVAEILLPQPRLLVDFDVISAVRRRLLLVGCEGREDALCGLACTPVGRGEEVEGVVGSEEGA
jgi:hypothetical protein